MILPGYRRINKNDYDEKDQALVDKLASSLNIAIESLYNAITKNISISDNILCTFKQVPVTVDSTGVPTSATAFAIATYGQIKGLQVINAVNNTNPNTYPTGGIFISYTQTSTGITINNITGLPANNQFTLSIIAYG